MKRTLSQINNKEHKEYRKIWISNFTTLITVIKFIVLFIAGIMLYIPFENDIKKAFQSKQSVQNLNKSSKHFEDDYDRIENGIHVQTGLVFAPEFDLVRANCTVCHSAKLITQNRATQEGWEQMITWMQESQGLWDLGNNKDKIVSYLAKHYAPEKKGRREQIDVSEIEWYILDLGE